MEREGHTGSGTTDALEIPARASSRADRADALAPGAVVLGKYRVEGRLGSGGMAEVYEATHVQLGSRVALKLPLGRKAGATIAARLLREAKVGASLDPEYVVRVFDVGTLDDGTPAIVLERLHGKSVAEHLEQDGAVSPALAARWIRDVCRGLARAHDQGIVHRDVKPSNLFLEQRPHHADRVRILDFGIAQVRAAAEAEVTDGLTDSRAAIGSPPYMSPEQLRDPERVDARADVWALGVTLFELVAARRPFRGHGTALVASILSDAPPRLTDLVPEVDGTLADIVARCLRKDPSGRPADAGELGGELDQWLDGVQPARGGAPRGRALSVVGALLAVGAVGAAIAWGVTRSPNAPPTGEVASGRAPIGASRPAAQSPTPTLGALPTAAPPAADIPATADSSDVAAIAAIPSASIGAPSAPPSAAPKATARRPSESPVAQATPAGPPSAPPATPSAAPPTKSLLQDREF